MNRPAFRVLIVAMAVIFTASWAYAVEEYGATPGQKQSMQGQQAAPQSMPGQATRDQAATGTFKPNLTEVSKMLGMKANAQAGENLGTVQDLILDPYESRVSFAVLSPSAGGDSLYAVPWSLISMSSGKDAVSVNISKQQFDNAPCFNRSDWPDVSSTQWRHQLYSHYNVQPASQSVQWPGEASGKTTVTSPSNREQMTAPQEQDQQRTATAQQQSQQDQQRMTAAQRQGQKQGQMMFSRRVSDLLGMNVKNPSGDDLGKIRDVVIDTEHGHIAYSILALPAEADQQLAVVPWSAMEISSRTQMARLDTDLKTLQASTFTEGDLTRLSNEQYARTVYDRFDREPYWEVYGYAPGRPAGGQSTSVWAPDSPYNKQFNEDKIVNIEGTVMSVGTFFPLANATPGLRLTIESKDGRLYTVGAGPWDYIQKQNVRFSNGDEVTVTGSEISSGTIMATEIKGEDKTLSVRSRSGDPKWSMTDLQTTSPSMQR